MRFWDNREGTLAILPVAKARRHPSKYALTKGEIRVVEGRFCMIDRSSNPHANRNDLPLGRNVAVSLNVGDQLPEARPLSTGMTLADI